MVKKEKNIQLELSEKLLKFIPVSIIMAFIIVFVISFFGKIQQTEVIVVGYKSESIEDVKADRPSFQEWIYRTPFGSKIYINEYSSSQKVSYNKIKLEGMFKGTLADYPFLFLFSIILYILRYIQLYLRSRKI